MAARQEIQIHPGSTLPPLAMELAEAYGRYKEGKEKPMSLVLFYVQVQRKFLTSIDPNSPLYSHVTEQDLQAMDNALAQACRSLLDTGLYTP